MYIVYKHVNNVNVYIMYIYIVILYVYTYIYIYIYDVPRTQLTSFWIFLEGVTGSILWVKLSDSLRPRTNQRKIKWKCPRRIPSAVDWKFLQQKDDGKAFKSVF